MYNLREIWLATAGFEDKDGNHEPRKEGGL